MSAEISQAAQDARERLHQEIERVRLGVEEMLDDHDSGNGNGNGTARGLGPSTDSSEVRRELEELRLETRNYVKKRVRKSEKKLERSMRELDDRTQKLERRIEKVAADREAAEIRIHEGTEKMLDGLLAEIREIADRLAGMPSPAAAKPAAPAGPAAPSKPAAAAKAAAPAQKPASPTSGLSPPPKRQPRPGPSSQGPVGRIGPPVRRAG